jgi:hypothetical protein
MSDEEIEESDGVKRTKDGRLRFRTIEVNKGGKSDNDE